MADDGGPAFPSEMPQGMGAAGAISRNYRGMSLRDYFAAQAIEAVAKHVEFDPREVARIAYLIADAMLERRGPASMPPPEPVHSGGATMTLR